MNDRSQQIKKYKEEMKSRAKATKPFLGLAGNANLIAIKSSRRFLTVQIGHIARLCLCAIFFIFGPGITYVYFNHQDKWNQNLNLYIELWVLFFVIIGWIFFIRYLFFHKKIKIDKLNGTFHFRSYPWKVTRVLNDDISHLTIDDYTFRSQKGRREIQCYILCLVLINESKKGLFITNDRSVVDEFLSHYKFKEMM